MSTLVLSILLVFLVFLGLVVMPTREFFDNPTQRQNQRQNQTVSPTLANMTITPTLTPDPPKRRTDALSRDAVVQQASSMPQVKHMKPIKPSTASKNRCPKCPTCPDMSQYVRLDEVPCWNCSLP
jgi:hypothetical protein